MLMSPARLVTSLEKPLDIAYDLLGRVPAASQKERMLTLARKLLNYYKLWDWNIGTHTRKGYWGLCSYGKATITLQANYANSAPEADVIDTILHEIAHALIGPGKGHGAEWKAMAVKLGARPKSCKSTDMPDTYYKWSLSCPSACGVVLRYHRKPSPRTLNFRRCLCTIGTRMVLEAVIK